MWEAILDAFEDSPSQGRVVRFLLENGFGVSAAGKIVCNGIEIPGTHIARAAGTDRRVVDSTARRILEIPELKEIFLNLRATPDISRVAESLGLTVITILPKNAQQKGIVGAAVNVLAGYDLSIRQIFVTDPLLSEDPKLVIVVDEPLPGTVYEELKALPAVRQLII
ncbi:MAG: regulator of amino acid metabolism, contains ACT domain protein [Methanomicrobiales archaeon]|nr:regulator of amino acid metabolism, contains ACT domain protein [Methanomicrobiales archaeon]